MDEIRGIVDLNLLEPETIHPEDKCLACPCQFEFQTQRLKQTSGHVFPNTDLNMSPQGFGKDFQSRSVSYSSKHKRRQ